jgi:hypothetical protein
MVNGTKTW